MDISDLKGKEIVGTFYEKQLQKISHKEFRIEKYLKEKTINYITNIKVMIIYLIFGLIKKTYYNWMNIFQNWNF